MLKNLSYSSVSSYRNCPYLWAQRYLKGRYGPTGEPLVFGQAVHTAVEQYIAARVQGQEPDLGRLWDSAFEGEVQKRERGSGVNWRNGSKEQSYRDGKRLLTGPVQVDVQTGVEFEGGVMLLSQFLDQIVPLMTPSKYSFEPSFDGGVPALERYVEMRVEGVPLKVLGYVDLVQANGVPIDFKTANRSWSDGDADKEGQPQFYLPMLENKGLKLNTERTFVYVVLVRDDEPRVQVFQTHRTEEQIGALKDMVWETWQDIKAGLDAGGDFDRNFEFRWCGPRYCEFWDTDCEGAWSEREPKATGEQAFLF